MSFNPPSRSQPMASAGSNSQGTASQPLSSSQLNISDLNTSISSEILLAAAIAVRNSAKKRSMSVDRANRSANENNLTSTPIRGRSPVRDRSSSVNPNPVKQKTGQRALFVTTPKTDSANTSMNMSMASLPNRVFDDDMERNRPADGEVGDGAQRREISEAPEVSSANVTMNESQGLNESRMTWGQESFMTIASVRTTRGKVVSGTSAKAAAAARVYWTDLLKVQRDWYIKVTTSRFPSKTAARHVLDAYGELKSALSSFSVKPPEAVEAMELFAVHNTRLYVFLTERAIPDSATALAEFTHALLTKYLANPTHMHENDRAWLLAKHILDIIIVIPSSTDILLSVKSTVSQIQTEFIRIWAASHAERDLRFIAYAIMTLDQMASKLSARISQVVNAMAFGYSDE